MYLYVCGSFVVVGISCVIGGHCVELVLFHSRVEVSRSWIRQIKQLTYV